MKLIVGLGNPGSKYSHTRHNIGRLLVESIAAERSVKFSKKKSLQASLGSGTWDGQAVSLAYPEMLMNVSGQAVKGLVEALEIDPERDLLIVVDEFALSFGRLRLRPQGSDGGHNGLKSVEASLNLQTYPRLRLGIGPCAPGMDPADFVLDRFRTGEIEELPDFFEKGREACRLWVTASIEAAMNVVNAHES